MKSIPIDFNEYTEEELLSMPYKEAVKGLSEKLKSFCESYVESHNRKTAMIKAGFSSEVSSTVYARRIMQKKEVQVYIQWLKVRVLKQHLINAYDLIDAWVRIAFSDITDFVEIHPTTIRLKPCDQVDGQLIKSIKSGRDGISIELHDKMRALENLSRYVDDMPSDWKQRIEERKIQLMEEEFELKKKLQEFGKDEEEDDGFIEAIKKSAETIWED